MVDLAVGVIIGVAFGAIINSLVGDIIMPIIGAATGGLDFSNYYTALSSKVAAGASYADAKRRRSARLGSVSHCRVELPYCCVGAVPRDQGEVKLQQVEGIEENLALGWAAQGSA